MRQPRLVKGIPVFRECLADLESKRSRLVDAAALEVQHGHPEHERQCALQIRGKRRRLPAPGRLQLPDPVGETAVRKENLRAVQLRLGHSKLESTVRYLGIEVDDALEISEQTEI